MVRGDDKFAKQKAATEKANQNKAREEENLRKRANERDRKAEGLKKLSRKDIKRLKGW
jgi:hypothetical protein